MASSSWTNNWEGFVLSGSARTGVLTSFSFKFSKATSHSGFQWGSVFSFKASCRGLVIATKLGTHRWQHPIVPRNFLRSFMVLGTIRSWMAWICEIDKACIPLYNTKPRNLSLHTSLNLFLWNLIPFFLEQSQQLLCPLVAYFICFSSQKKVTYIQ